jgi:quinohemoprotein ethanol dehydrogenase
LPKPPPQFASAEVIARGKVLYEQASCFVCHGIQQEVPEGGSFRDLRYIPPAVHAQWNDIVLGGALSPLGMPSFKDSLNVSEAQAIRAFIITRAQALYDAEKKGGP